MQLKIYKDHDALSHDAAAEIVSLVKGNPKAVLCLASGDTPRLAYSFVVTMSREEKISLSECTFVALDEWIGIPPENEGSCQYFLRQNLFEPLNIVEKNVHFFDALSPDPQEECRKMNNIILEKGGIDMMLIGIGMNGHVGFNEPGTPFHQYAQVVDLDETSRVVGQKYFRQSTPLTKGITLGLAHMLEAKKALLVASGLKKAEIIKKTLEEDISPRVPASAIRNHANGIVMLDEAAASLLNFEL